MCKENVASLFIKIAHPPSEVSDTSLFTYLFDTSSSLWDSSCWEEPFNPKGKSIQWNYFSSSFHWMLCLAIFRPPEPCRLLPSDDWTCGVDPWRDGKNPECTEGPLGPCWSLLQSGWTVLLSVPWTISHTWHNWSLPSPSNAFFIWFLATCLNQLRLL